MRYAAIFIGVRTYVSATKPIRWTPVAVPKRAGQPGARRGTKRLSGDGSRRKGEAGDEPQGCASRRALGERKSRSYEGNCALSRLGIRFGDVLPRFALCVPHASEKSWLHRDCNFYACTRNRRKHSNLSPKLSDFFDSCSVFGQRGENQCDFGVTAGQK